MQRFEVARAANVTEQLRHRRQDPGRWRSSSVSRPSAHHPLKGGLLPCTQRSTQGRHRGAPSARSATPSEPLARRGINLVFYCIRIRHIRRDEFEWDELTS